MNKLKEIIEKIDSSQRVFDETVYSSVSEKDKAYFADWVNKICPDEKIDFSIFVSFCEIANGLNNNGLFVYSIIPQSENNIYDSNEDWWDVPENKKYIFLGDDDISWYCMEIASGDCYVLDKPSGENIDKYESIEELLLFALTTSLN